jgi:L-rhamnose isomerase
MDNGHYHPTEVVSDKISSLLLFNEKIALHVTRAVRWDSDHVVIFDDETKEIAKEIVRNDALDRVFIALDYFDASVNRIAAWVVGARNMQKALLFALLNPAEQLRGYQDAANYTKMLSLSEELKTFPFGEVFDEYCKRVGAPVGMSWIDDVDEYERDVLSKR